ncbi:hypothetical protein [Vibrio sp.]|uniref:hypothetical protein n=1 Tax=Vibrio sp. TaxID=678 RepID=UPI003F6ACA42
MFSIRFATQFISSIFAGLLLVSSCAHANSTEQSTHLKLVTIVPVVASMTQELVENTSIEVTLLPPTKYNIKRIPGWLERQPPEAYPMADAVIGISSVWKNVDAYPALRNQNIAVIPIDVAQALLPKGEKVATLQHQGESASYFWLSPANSLIMLGILHRDLLLVIEHHQIEELDKVKRLLNQNFDQMHKSLRQSQIQLETALFDLEFMQVVIDKPELKDLASSTLLPIVEQNDILDEEFATVLISNRKPNHSSFKSLPKHVFIWSVDDFSKSRSGSYTKRWQKNVIQLKAKQKG